jgi:acetoin utilization deacetylase AcuC-like enzyme
MDILYNSIFLAHNQGSSGEGPYRIAAFSGQKEAATDSHEEHTGLVHSQVYADYIRQACRHSGILAEVEVTPQSWEAALQAVGLTILASQQNGFAVVRPPGHHAKPDRADGFCLFNNIAIATSKLVEEGKKVFILDIDGHHGDGTQQIFYESDRVLFCSLHQQYAYPWTGDTFETGRGEGLGFTMNFPLPAGSGDRQLVECVIRTVDRALQFKPDVVGVSAGFDGYEKDRLLGLNYTLGGYREVGRILGENFSNVFAVLEGGYHDDIRLCVEHFIAGIHQEAL